MMVLLFPSFSLAKQWLLSIRCREDFTIRPLWSEPRNPPPPPPPSPQALLHKMAPRPHCLIIYPRSVTPLNRPRPSTRATPSHEETAFIGQFRCLFKYLAVYWLRAARREGHWRGVLHGGRGVAARDWLRAPRAGRGPAGHRPAGAPQPLTALGAAGSSPAPAPRPAEVTGGAGGGAGCEGAQGGRDVKSHGKNTGTSVGCSPGAGSSGGAAAGSPVGRRGSSRPQDFARSSVLRESFH